MKTNTTRQRLLDGRQAVGTILFSGSILAAGVLGRAGFDFVVVDNQHGDWDDANSAAAFRSISFGTAMPMARVRQNDFYAIGRLLDRGALGIMVPMVNSPAEAREAARAMRYPPRGERSMGPMLAGFHGADYVSWADDQVYLAVQIETAAAAVCAEEILSVEGVDGCWVGPADLGLSLRLDLRSAEGRAAHEQALLGILAACRRAGKVPGIHCTTLAMAQRWLQEGYQLVTVSADTDLMLQGAAVVLQGLGR